MTTVTGTRTVTSHTMKSGSGTTKRRGGPTPMVIELQGPPQIQLKKTQSVPLIDTVVLIATSTHGM